MPNTLKTSLSRGPQFYKFSDCFLDTVERRLFKKNERLDVTPKSLEVLQVLVENAGEVVSKDDLLDQIWGDSFVEEGNLPVQISKLRSQLGASKDEPYIVTESGVGYQFVSRVSIVDDDEWADLIENELAQRENGKQKYTSIAIMPLENESGDEDVEYLADGITESLINSLAHAKDLRVIARNTVFQFKESEIDIKKLGRKLRVATILTGRIRVVRDNIVISVELTKVADGSQIWGTHLNDPFDDIFKSQGKLSTAIAEALRFQVHRLNDAISSFSQGARPESYRYYLKGQFQINKRSITQSLNAAKSFNKSIEFDPLFAGSYIELAYTHIFHFICEVGVRRANVDKVEFCLQKAREMSEPDCAFYTVRGYKSMVIDLDLSAAETDFNRAIAINPQDLRVRYHLSNLLALKNDVRGALYQVDEISRYDPFSTLSNKRIARVMLLLGNYEAVLIGLNECLEIEPEDFETYLMLGSALVELDRLDEAENAFKKSLELQSHPETLAMIAYTKARANKTKEAKKIISDLKQMSQKSHVSPFYIGFVYASLNELTSALKYLKRAEKYRYVDLLALNVDVRWRNMRKQEGFLEIVAKLNLDEIKK